MSKNICVYLHDADPTQESFRFRISRDDARHRVDILNVAYWLSRNAIQLKPPPDWIAPTKHTGLFGETWRIRPSAHYLVWQMVPIDENR